MASTSIVVQARLTSSRYPAKMFAQLKGMPIIEWVEQRLKNIDGVDDVVFAVPDSTRNDELFKFLVARGCVVFRGSESNVLRRFLSAAESVKSRNIIRVCADRPLICSNQIRSLIQAFASGNESYLYNHAPPGIEFIGFGAEICSIEILREISIKATEQAHTEHIFNYLWDNKLVGEANAVKSQPLLASQRKKFDVDVIEDLIFLNRLDISPSMSMEEILIKASELDNDELI